MFRKSFSSSAHLLSNNGSCILPEKEKTEAMDASPLPSLVYYAAVAKGTMIVAEYAAEGNTDLPATAAACLENVPPLHNRFSYTTNKRRFICIFDGFLTHCAITDEALSKADAFSFLQTVRDAFKAFRKGRGPDSVSLTLGAHFLDEEMVPVMRNLAAQFIGVPQREKESMEAELPAQCDVEVEMEVSSPSAVAPLHEMSDHEFDSKTKEKPLGSRSSRIPLIGKIKKGKKKTKEQMKEVIVDDREKVMNAGSNLEILVDGGLGAGMEKGRNVDIKGKQLAQKTWRRNVKLVIMLDVLACLILLAVWLGVCEGISCLRR